MKVLMNEILKNYPEIEDIATRLEQSRQSAEERNRSRGRGTAADLVDQSQQGENKKGIFLYTPEHAVISKYYKNGQWLLTPYTIKPGREAFLEDLSKLISTREPEGIRIEIYKGKTQRTAPVYSKDIYLSDQAEEKETETEKEKEKNPELGALIKRFDETIAEAKSNPASAIELLKKDFEAKLTANQHATEIKDLKAQYQSEINALQAIIKEKDQHIDELEDELDNSQGELGSLQAEAMKEKRTPLSEIMISRMLVQVGENLLKNNPKILKVGLGLSDEEVKKIFEKESKQLESGNSSGDNSNFSEAGSSSIDLQGLNEKHREGIEAVIQFSKAMPVEDFKKIYTIILSLQDQQTTLLNKSLADKVIQFISSALQAAQ